MYQILFKSIADIQIYILLEIATHIVLTINQYYHSIVIIHILNKTYSKIKS